MKKFVLIFCLYVVSALASATNLEAKNLFQLKADLIDQDGKPAPLSIYEGHSTFVSMFYASCPMMCPTLIEDIKSFELLLTETQRKDFRVLLISFDPENDKPKDLQTVIKRHKLDKDRWKLTNAKTEKKTREIATALGVKFRRQADKINYDHTAVVNLISAQGDIKGHWEGTDLSKSEKSKDVLKLLK